MTPKQMVEAVQEHFPQKNGLRILGDLNNELRRYSEDVRCFHENLDLFAQPLCTEDGHEIVTHAYDTIRVEEYGSQYQLPDNVFIVRASRSEGAFRYDINGRRVTLYQDIRQHTLFERTQDMLTTTSLMLDCVVRHKRLAYDSEEDLQNHSDAIVAGVLGRYYGAVGNYNAAGWWNKEAAILRRKAKEVSTTDGSYGFTSVGPLTPPKERR